MVPVVPSRRRYDRSFIGALLDDATILLPRAKVIQRSEFARKGGSGDRRLALDRLPATSVLIVQHVILGGLAPIHALRPQVGEKHPEIVRVPELRLRREQAEARAGEVQQHVDVWCEVGAQEERASRLDSQCECALIKVVPPVESGARARALHRRSARLEQVPVDGGIFYARMFHP